MAFSGGTTPVGPAPTLSTWSPTKAAGTAQSQSNVGAEKSSSGGLPPPPLVAVLTAPPLTLTFISEVPSARCRQNNSTDVPYPRTAVFTMAAVLDAKSAA